MDLDHVLIAVADLDAAGREFEERYGLASVEGGRHPGWGTANRIIPLGGNYLELIAVVDESEATAHPFGRWVTRREPASAKLLGWAVRTHDIDEVSNRLGLTPTAGSRQTRDGHIIRWRTAGTGEAIAEPSLPFFIQWDQGTPFPGRIRVTHPADPVSIAGLELAGDPDRMARWLGPHRLPIRVRPGPPALVRVVLTGDRGEIVLGATLDLTDS